MGLLTGNLLWLQGADAEDMAAVKEALWQLKSVCRAETMLLWKNYRHQMETEYGRRLQVCPVSTNSRARTWPLAMLQPVRGKKQSA